MSIGAANVPSPQSLRDRVIALRSHRQRDQEEWERLRKKLCAVRGFLELAPKVDDALDRLSQELFRQTVTLLEDKLSIALQEVLEQPIHFKGEADFKRGSASLEFHVERGPEQAEDILRGQGGSVTNVLSVGLRMFALTMLDEKEHRRFLVLDEQDCWLRPDLVPRLVKIVREARDALGFQVLMISHHDVSAFERYADRIYQCEAGEEGAVVSKVESEVADPDSQ